jgi:hypothetical protein
VEDTRSRTAEPEWLIVNPVDSKPGATTQLRRWILIGALALALIMITAARVGLSQEADDVTRSSSSTTPDQVSYLKQDQNEPVAVRKPRVLRHGRPLLPTRSRWELYAQTDTEVIRIEPGAGRVTGTGVLAMPNTEPRAGVLVPTGPQVWVMRECDTRRFCRRVIIDQRGSRSQDNVDLARGNVAPWLATMSPNGRYVSVVYASATHPVTLHLLDVRRGSSRVTTVQVDRTIHSASFAWSPDSDYLFVAGVNGILWVIEPATAAVSEFPVRLPPVRHLAVTPAQR